MSKHIRILEHRAVMIDDRLHEAGEEAEVSDADAKTLVDEGYAEFVGRRGSVKAGE